MTLEELNACDQARFTRALGWIYEESPWVAERAWPRRPFASVDELHQAMSAVVDAAKPEQQLQLLRSHPDLGARVGMSDASVGEQRGAGLDSLSPDEHQRLLALNTTYREKFGFPFLFAVKGRTRHDVLAALERRLGDDCETERREAMGQVHRIALFRLQDLVT